MTTNALTNRISTRVPLQLPEFIRNEESYQTFVTFIQAYYEWLEESNIGDSKQGAVYGTQNLVNYADIDTTMDEFVEYFINDFLPNFPKDALTDRTKLLKIAKQLYSTKGTPSSYKFLFRALYNSDAEINMTRDVVLRASDGKWYIPKSLKLATENEQFLSIDNLRLFGEETKSIATVERSIRSGAKIEVYISNIERLFQSGEFVRVVDNNNQTVYFKDGVIVPAGTPGSSSLTAKIVGSIASVAINPNKRGQLYVAGDPVVFYGGLDSVTAAPAKAIVEATTSGSLRDVQILNGSYGYRADPNTYITFSGGGGTGAIANVSTLNPNGRMDVTYIPQDFLGLSGATSIKLGANNYPFFKANTSANINCSLANAFTFAAFSTYPIGSVALNNGGGGYTSLPTVSAKSLYDTTDPQTTPNLKAKGDLAALGILAPIIITTPGQGYANGDIINFTGGAGTGAHANVTVNATGSIVSAQYVYSNTVNGVVTYPLGGLGYKSDSLPMLSVTSSGGSNVALYVPTVLGTGATFASVADERGIGAITSFLVEDFGEDYISAPSISLKIRDIVVKNVSLSNIVKTGETVYQGTSNATASFKAFTDSITLLEQNADPANTKYILRTYNYTSNTSTSMQLKVTDREGLPNVYMDIVTTYNTQDASGNYLFKDGIRTYGNGAAEATAKFLNGLIIGEGQYLNDDGFPSSFHVLESTDYNDYTYQLKVEQSFSAYQDVLFKLLHPAGTKVVPINMIKSAEKVEITRESYSANSQSIGYYTGADASGATMTGTWNNTSNNIVQFTNLAGANLSTFLYVGSKLSITSSTGPNVYSDVISVDGSSNTAVISDNVFLTFANVATANVVSTEDVINSISLTGNYDLINNGEYSNTQNHLEDIVFTGDKIRVYANASNNYEGTVTYVSLSNNVIFVTPSLSFSANSALLSVGRTISAEDGSVRIYNTLGTIYYPELTTENGQSLTTEDGKLLILG